MTLVNYFSSCCCRSCFCCYYCLLLLLLLIILLRVNIIAFFFMLLLLLWCACSLQVQHWAEDIPHYTSPDGSASVTIWAGSYGGVSALEPPTNSYAAQPDSDVGIWHITLKPGGGSFTLPAASTASTTSTTAAGKGATVNRCAYFTEGQSLTIGGTALTHNYMAVLDAAQDATFVNTHDNATTEVLVMQGRPIGEPVAQHGPFVMNTREEIQQAFSDYQRTQFGGWPWPSDAMVSCCM